MVRAAVLVVAALLVCMTMTWSADRPEGSPGATRSVVHATHGMVAAAHPLAVQIGVDILKRGGSAVDAAIAVNAALAFMEPVSCGLGGDLFAMVWDPATRRADRAQRLGPGAAAADPGDGAGGGGRHDPALLAVLLDRAGLRRRLVRAPRALRAPADRGGPRSGHRCGPRRGAGAAGDRRGLGARARERSGTSPASPRSSCPAAGRRPRASVFANPALARTLRDDRGRRSRRLLPRPDHRAAARVLEPSGGFFSAEDFAGHRSDWVEPISTTYRGVTVYELPPNGQGLAALQMLSMLELHDLAGLGRANPDFWHLLIEAKKLAYADRARFYADPTSRTSRSTGSLDKEYARAAGGADRHGTGCARRGPRRSEARGGRHHLPRDRRLQRHDGVADPVQLHRLRLGLRGARARLRPAGPGRSVQPRGRAPERARARQAAVPHHHPGVHGRGRHAECRVRRHGRRHAAPGPRADRGQPGGLRDEPAGGRRCTALPAHRLHEPTGTQDDRWRRGLTWSPASPVEVRRELLRRGHRLQEASGSAFGGYQAIWRDPVTGVFSGATESRKDGAAAGY